MLLPYEVILVSLYKIGHNNREKTRTEILQVSLGVKINTIHAIMIDHLRQKWIPQICARAEIIFLAIEESCFSGYFSFLLL